MSTIKHSQISALLVDDDAKLCGLLRDYLEGFGFSLDVAEDASSGLEKALLLPDAPNLSDNCHGEECNVHPKHISRNSP